jgi:hypothetical protein
VETGLTVVELATFTGQDEAYYSSYVDEAILQAGDLFELATELDEMPEDDGIDLRIANRGVLAMAEAIYEGQSFRSLRFTPFRSETLGSYSYSIAERSVLSGVPTGISWFDAAVSRFTSTPTVSHSAFDNVFDDPRIWHPYETPQAYTWRG